MKKLQKTLNDLKKFHRDIRKELAKIEDSVFEEFLGESYSKKLRQNLKRYGDGHILYSLPRSVDELANVDALVLVIAFSPKLEKDSDFNPFTPLHTIPYWRDNKRLSPKAHSSKSRRKYKLHFMSWQKNVTIHGKDDRHAEENRKLLVENRPNLEYLFQQEIDASVEFINNCIDCLIDAEKPVVILTDHRSHFDKPVDKPVLTLIDNPNTIHKKVQIRGMSHKIMGQISDVLP